MLSSVYPDVSDSLKEGKLELVFKGSNEKDKGEGLNNEELQKEIFKIGEALNFISLTSSVLSSIHTDIGKCSHLGRLVLAKNNISELPESIGTLKNLTFLDVSNNCLKQLPTSFEKLPKLESLIANNNQLTGTNFLNLAALKALLVLDLSYNAFTSMPSSLCQEPGPLKLHTVDFSHNKMSTLNTGFVCSQLKTFNLSNNVLVEIPTALAKYPKMKVLDLSGNKFKDGRFGKLTNDSRAKISAVITYIAKTKPSKQTKESESQEGNTAEEEKAPEETLPKINVHIGREGMSVQALAPVKTVRPYLVCCVIRNVDLSGNNFRKFINIQTKLHGSICDNRLTAAIGTHELNSFVPPLTYLALPSQEVHITALHKKTPVSGKELIEALVRDADLARRRTKRSSLNPLHKYLHLVEKLPLLPCLIDSNGLVISLEPITNSDLTKMSEETKNVWIEVSSEDSLQICKTVMDEVIMETLAIDPNITVDQVQVMSGDDLLSTYPDQNDLPLLSQNRVKST